jgi:alkanesulfonate monooxygenase SsuD/methylene tetrahydromethanopterin reductase-like flavin-dependent oxidoreductase (luciferase family)
MGNYADTAIRHYEYDEPEHFRKEKGYEFHTKMAEATKANSNAFREMFTKTQVYGTPDQCLAALRTIAQTMDAAEYIAVFKYGGMPLELAKRSMKLFASEVLPHLQRGTSPMVQSAAAGGR